MALNGIEHAADIGADIGITRRQRLGAFQQLESFVGLPFLMEGHAKQLQSIGQIGHERQGATVMPLRPVEIAVLMACRAGGQRRDRCLLRFSAGLRSSLDLGRRHGIPVLATVLQTPIHRKVKRLFRGTLAK